MRAFKSGKKNSPWWASSPRLCHGQEAPGTRLHRPGSHPGKPLFPHRDPAHGPRVPLFPDCAGPGRRSGHGLPGHPGHRHGGPAGRPRVYTTSWPLIPICTPWGRPNGPRPWCSGPWSIAGKTPCWKSLPPLRNTPLKSAVSPKPTEPASVTIGHQAIKVRYRTIALRGSSDSP